MGIVDQRTSVDIGIKISVQIIKVTLAILTVLVGLATFILSNYEVTGWFYVFGSLSILFLFASIYKAGQGINIARLKGFKGEWSLDYTRQHFNHQAILCIIGTIMLFLILATPKTKNNDILISTLYGIKDEISTTQSTIIKIEELKKEVTGLENRVLNLEAAIEQSKKTEHLLNK